MKNNNINKERKLYTNQNCTNYNNYILNSNYKTTPFEGEELDDISKLGTEYSNEFAFDSKYSKKQCGNKNSKKVSEEIKKDNCSDKKSSKSEHDCHCK